MCIRLHEQAIHQHDEPNQRVEFFCKGDGTNTVRACWSTEPVPWPSLNGSKRLSLHSVSSRVSSHTPRLSAMQQPRHVLLVFSLVNTMTHRFYKVFVQLLLALTTHMPASNLPSTEPPTQCFPQ